MRTLAADGYASAEVDETRTLTEIIIRATRTREVLGEKVPKDSSDYACCAEASGLPREQREALRREGSWTVQRGTMTQAESKRHLPLGGAVRRACHTVV